MTFGKESWDVAAQPEHVPVLRRQVRDALRSWGRDELADDVATVLSELMANVVLHAPGRAQVTVLEDEDGLLLEVADSATTMPAPRLATESGTTGRGLGLVTSLTESWGFSPRTDGHPGKVVWCRFSWQPRETSTGVDVDALLSAFDDEPSPGYDVVIGEAPTELVAAAKDHLDGLLRELALAESYVGGALPKEIVESITSAVSRFAVARAQLRRELTRAQAEGRRRVLVRFSLPAELADAGEAYLEALAEADAHARDRRMLSLESPAAYRVLREWYVRALVDGLRRAAAGEAPAETAGFEERLLEELEAQEQRARRTELAAQLQHVTSRLAAAMSLEDIARIAVAEGMLALGASGGTLTRPLGERAVAVVEAGADEGLHEVYDADPTSPQGPSSDAMRTMAPVFVGGRDERDARYPHLAAAQPDVLAVAAVPLTVVGEAVGALRFTWAAPRLFTEPERSYLEGLAAQTAQAVARSDALHERRISEGERDRALERMRLLNDVGVALTATLDVDEALTRLARRLVPVLGDVVSVDLAEGDDVLGARGVVILAADPAKADALRRAEALAPRRNNPESAVNKVLRGAPMVVVTVAPKYLARAAEGEQLEIYRSMDMRFAAVVPLVARGRVFGALSLIRTGSDAVAFSDEEQQLALELGRRAGLIVDNAAQYDAQRRVAEGLQRSLLPELPRHPGVRLGAVYEPSSSAAKVGGDWYDAFGLPDGSLGLVIGDVMGHDIAAAAAMGQLRSVVRTCAADGDDPGRVLDRLDRLVSSFSMADLATVVYARLTHRPDGSAELSWANAGHPPPLLLVRGERARFLDQSASTMIGVEIGEPRRPATEVLPPGSTLLMYTDGLVERRGSDLDEGLELVRRTADALEVESPRELCLRLIEAVRRGGSSDDVAVVAVTLD